MNKKDLSERDICTKFITPAIINAGWDRLRQFREEVFFTDGRIYVRGRITARGQGKRADYILYYKPAIPVAVIEAKDNNHSVGAGMQQALEYARILDVPCVFSSNGDGFLFHDRTTGTETHLSLDALPSPEALWEKYKIYKGLNGDEPARVAAQDYFSDASGRAPRYYQQIAVNQTVEAVAKGQDRILLVMATGTGKTYTAFQIAYRLWRAGVKKRILFLADRNVLIDQARRADFKHFRDKLTVVKNRNVDKSYEVYLSLYQGISGQDDAANIYKQFSPGFFDLIIVDECHRGSAAEDSAWREILQYFKSATQIGLTATPKETEVTSNSEYFGDPIYTYSLRQGIEDGFLAPYRVVKVTLNVDAEGWRPEPGKKDKSGADLEDRIYNRKDFDRTLVIDERTATVARKISEYLKGTDRFAKTIVFCRDIDHAERVRSALVNENSDLVREDSRYVVRITGDNDEGKRELDNFINPEERYPVIATTSKLMTTGVDAQTCKLIVLDSEIGSMTEFKQIIGRGTRINEAYGKLYFTILDFRSVTDHFADPAFDGDPVRVKNAGEDDDLGNTENEEENGESSSDDTPPVPHPDDVPSGRSNDDPGPDYTPREKVYVNGVDVSILSTRAQYFDSRGKPVTTSLKEHTRSIIQDRYASLDVFLNSWNGEAHKTALMQELEEAGVLVPDLLAAVEGDVDLFDLILHLAFDQPPLTRRERAAGVRKRNAFGKWGDAARRVLDALLDKYADSGVENIESMDVLKVAPLTGLGSPVELVAHFGGKAKYLEAVRELEAELYKIA